MTPPDIEAAAAFMTTHARLLDRSRFLLLLGRAEPSQVLAGLAAYRNPDGGYGWGLEPDLRDAASQPVGAMHALEVLAEAAPGLAGQGLGLFDWLQEHTLTDGGLPFALPVADPAGCAPHWVAADPAVSSLQMTAQVAANAHLLARHQPGTWALAGHPWLATATRYCLDAIAGLTRAPTAYETLFALRFLDAVGPGIPEAAALLAILGRLLPANGLLPVEGGIEGEMLRPLDFSPLPGTPVRELFAPDVVAADLDRLSALQQADGGWTVDFASSSPVAALEWRGYRTVQAVDILIRNGALPIGR